MEILNKIIFGALEDKELLKGILLSGFLHYIKITSLSELITNPHINFEQSIMNFATISLNSDEFEHLKKLFHKKIISTDLKDLEDIGLDQKKRWQRNYHTLPC